MTLTPKAVDKVDKETAVGHKTVELKRTVYQEIAS